MEKRRTLLKPAGIMLLGIIVLALAAACTPKKTEAAATTETTLETFTATVTETPPENGVMG